MSFTTAEHHGFFRDFIRLETAVGGPDPHLATLGGMLRDEAWEERVWRCGLYASGYNVPTAEIIWQHWPWRRVLDERAALTPWVAQHWPGGFGLRRERRAVRTATKFARCLESIADWTIEVTQRTPDWWTDPAGFEGAWHSTGTVYGLGRYVQLKLVEALSRYADAAFEQTDIRAKGGTSPREGLALLYPEHERWLLAGGTVEQVEYLAASLLEDLRAGGYRVDFFVLQVVLCEYKKNWQGKQYPGRTHDTELRYLRDAQNYWGNQSAMLDARADVFLAESLGEQNGWWGARKSLEDTLPRHRYLWSDLTMDYLSTQDYGHPAYRAAPIAGLV